MLSDERYKKLMEDVGLPNSKSLLQALKQCAMEAVLNERAVLAKVQVPDAIALLQRVAGSSTESIGNESSKMLFNGSQWHAGYAIDEAAEASDSGYNRNSDEALGKSLSVYSEKAMPAHKQEPVYQVQSVGGFWLDVDERIFECHETRRKLYAAPPQAESIPECDCEALQSRIRHLERLLMGL